MTRRARARALFCLLCCGEEGLEKEEEGGGVTVSGVHVASCLAASEKPASDKHGLRHATSSMKGRGIMMKVVVVVAAIDTSLLEKVSTMLPISRYWLLFIFHFRRFLIYLKK